MEGPLFEEAAGGHSKTRSTEFGRTTSQVMSASGSVSQSGLRSETEQLLRLADRKFEKSASAPETAKSTNQIPQQQICLFQGERKWDDEPAAMNRVVTGGWICPKMQTFYQQDLFILP
jgi:hypothetical protein